MGLGVYFYTERHANKPRSLEDDLNSDSGGNADGLSLPGRGCGNGNGNGNGSNSSCTCSAATSTCSLRIDDEVAFDFPRVPIAKSAAAAVSLHRIHFYSFKGHLLRGDVQPGQ